MTSIYTQSYRNKKIPPILKEYCAKKYGRKREFVDAEINARLGVQIGNPEQQEITAPVQSDLSTTTITP